MTLKISKYYYTAAKIMTWLTFLIMGLEFERENGMLSTYYRTDTYTSEAYVDRANGSYIIVHYVNNVRYKSSFGDIIWGVWSLKPYAGTGRPIRIRYSKEDPSMLHPADMKHVKWAVLLDGILGWITLILFAFAINKYCIDSLCSLSNNPSPQSKEEEFDINNLF